MLEQAEKRVGRSLEALRLQLAHPDMLLVVSLLGLATGIVAGGVIVAFRFLVEFTQEGLLPGLGPENFEALPLTARLALPVAAGVLLAVMFRWFAHGQQMLGVARVMERMSYHQGHFTLREFCMQFFGAAIAIIGGHSVGREGPHVFLGAAAGSLLGRRLALPNNTIRTLVACGTAAGIGASFNTPLAGVIFALEVVMMEYTVASFIPVILASVSATVLSNLVFGRAPAFSMTVVELQGMTAMELVAALGVVVGTVSAGLNQALASVSAATRKVPLWWRLLAAGAGMAVLGALVPQVMGIGYDTVQLALDGELALTLICLLLGTKVVASVVSLGLGVPGGVIGPSLFVGAMSGALVANLVMLISPDTSMPVGTFALLGMGASMSASLQAPLAGLTAMFELTDNPGIILPGMLAVVVSGLTAKELFGKDSLFFTQLRAAGLEYRSTPVMQALRRRGVASAMDRSFATTAARLTPGGARDVLRATPQWLLVEGGDGVPEHGRILMPAADLARHFEATQEPEAPAAGGEEPALIDLHDIPANRRVAVPIAVQATLQEALEKLESSGAEALFVESVAGSVRRIYGILTRRMIERAYLP